MEDLTEEEKIDRYIEQSPSRWYIEHHLQCCGGSKQIAIRRGMEEHIEDMENKYYCELQEMEGVENDPEWAFDIIQKKNETIALYNDLFRCHDEDKKMKHVISIMKLKTEIIKIYDKLLILEKDRQRKQPSSPVSV
jgi:hypothetical protein